MDKLAAYEMLLEDHPLWTKVAGEARRARIVKSIMKKAPDGWGEGALTPGLERAFRTAHAKSMRNKDRIVNRVGQKRMAEELSKVMTPGGLDDFARMQQARPAKDPYAQVVKAGLSKSRDEINRMNQVSARGFLRDGR